MITEQRNTKKKAWITGLLRKLGLEVVSYRPQLSSKSHIQIKVKPLWYDPCGSQTLTVYIDPGYNINIKYSNHLDNAFRNSTDCIIASLILEAAEEYSGPDVEVSWVPYRRASSRGSSTRPDSCYLRLSCSYLPWKEKPECISLYKLKHRF